MGAVGTQAGDHSERRMDMDDIRPSAQHQEPGHGHQHVMGHVFWFGTHKLEAPAEYMNVRALKELIRQHIEGFNVAHTLVLEECGDRPDKPLHDDDDVLICDFPHFYDQPPANFG
jgi:hypothetical protein